MGNPDLYFRIETFTASTGMGSSPGLGKGISTLWYKMWYKCGLLIPGFHSKRQMRSPMRARTGPPLSIYGEVTQPMSGPKRRVHNSKTIEHASQQSTASTLCTSMSSPEHRATASIFPVLDKEATAQKMGHCEPIQVGGKSAQDMSQTVSARQSLGH